MLCRISLEYFVGMWADGWFGLTLVLVERSCCGGSEDRGDDGSRELHLGQLMVEGSGKWKRE